MGTHYKTSYLKTADGQWRHITEYSDDELRHEYERSKERIYEIDQILYSDKPTPLSLNNLADERTRLNSNVGVIYNEIILRKRRSYAGHNQKALNAGGVYLDNREFRTTASSVHLGQLKGVCL